MHFVLQKNPGEVEPKKKIWFSIFLAAFAVLSGLCVTNKNEYNKSIAKNARFFAKNAMRFFILAAIL